MSTIPPRLQRYGVSTFVMAPHCGHFDLRAFFCAVEEVARRWSPVPVSIGVRTWRQPTGRPIIYAIPQGYAAELTIRLFAHSADEAATHLNAGLARSLTMHPFWAEPISDCLPDPTTIPVSSNLAWDRAWP